MNISGVGVAAAWRQFARENKAGDTEPQLVVVHDEMELPLGKVKEKNGNSSAKGHNGLKSIKEQLNGLKYTRIGVGIGRPDSRDPEVVSRYVLRRVSGEERGKIEASAGGVEMALKGLMAGG